MAHVAASFDLDCSSLCYDGCDVWGLPTSIRALKTRYNVISPHTESYEAYRLRYPVICVCVTYSGNINFGDSTLVFRGFR